MLAAVAQPAAVEHLEARLRELRSELQPLPAATLVDDVTSAVLSDALGGLPAAVAAALSDESVGSAWAVEFLDRASALQRELHEVVSASHSQAVARVHEAFAGLDRDVSAVELVRRAPALLCEVGQFDRALISSVRGSTWLPAVLHVAVAAEDEVNVALAAEIAALEIPLTNSLIETELVRRRSSVLVEYASEDRRSFRPLMELSKTRAYVAAPIVAGDRVAGFLHADAYSSPRRLSVTDRAVLQTFADLFGLLYERAAMVDRLREQRQTIHAALASAEMSACLRRPQISSLARTGLTPAAAVALPVTPVSWDGPNRGGLTPREMEILALLATGATNGQIAARLVVSESTVKSHVKRILRKLPAANRAEAVYRYTRMARTGRRVS